MREESGSGRASSRGDSDADQSALGLAGSIERGARRAAIDTCARQLPRGPPNGNAREAVSGIRRPPMGTADHAGRLNQRLPGAGKGGGGGSPTNESGAGGAARPMGRGGGARAPPLPSRAGGGGGGRRRRHHELLR